MVAFLPVSSPAASLVWIWVTQQAQQGRRSRLHECAVLLVCELSLASVPGTNSSLEHVQHGGVVVIPGAYVGIMHP